MNPKLVGLLALMVVGLLLGLVAPLIFGNDWDRLRPSAYPFVGAVVFVGVFVVAYRQRTKK